MIPSLKSLNKFEALIGLVFGLVFAVKIGWWALVLAPFTAYFWASGGAKKEDGGNKLYRRLGCALFPALAVFAVHFPHWWCLLAVPLAFGVLSVGYGIPSTQPPDAGSVLGRWAYAIALKFTDDPRPEWLAEIITRTLIYLLLSLTFIPCWVA